MQKLINGIVPFIVLGIIIVIFVFGIILLSYLLIFGALVGLVLFLIAWVKEKFFPSKHMTTTKNKKPGITIEHDDR